MIFASGLKYAGVPTYPLGFTMGGILVAGAAFWLATKRLWQEDREPAPVLMEPAEAAAGRAEAAAAPRDDMPVR